MALLSRFNVTIFASVDHHADRNSGKGSLRVRYRRPPSDPVSAMTRKFCLAQKSPANGSDEGHASAISSRCRRPILRHVLRSRLLSGRAWTSASTERRLDGVNCPSFQHALVKDLANIVELLLIASPSSTGSSPLSACRRGLSSRQAPPGAHPPASVRWRNALKVFSKDFGGGDVLRRQQLVDGCQRHPHRIVEIDGRERLVFKRPSRRITAPVLYSRIGVFSFDLRTFEIGRGANTVGVPTITPLVACLTPLIVYEIGCVVPFSPSCTTHSGLWPPPVNTSRPDPVAMRKLTPGTGAKRSSEVLCELRQRAAVVVVRPDST